MFQYLVSCIMLPGFMLVFLASRFMLHTSGLMLVFLASRFIFDLSSFMLYLSCFMFHQPSVIYKLW